MGILELKEQEDLFGHKVVPKEIAVCVYHDEREVHNRWLYHSFLLVPLQSEGLILKLFDEARQRTGWHKELHFANLDKTDTENRLALELIDLFHRWLFGEAYFYFFGVNYRNLEKTLWIKAQRDFKVYNRFFQIGLYGAIEWFFLAAGFQKVLIQNIFSDKKPRKGEDRFHSQPIDEIETKASLKGKNIIFQCTEIIEIDSDHEKETDYPLKSHFIQFVDLMMGTFSQIFDDTSEQPGKCMAADRCVRFDLPAKLMKYNPNSRYYKKYAISFFPNRKLTKAEILEGTITGKSNQFYNERGMKYTSRNQLSLFKLLKGNQIPTVVGRK